MSDRSASRRWLAVAAVMFTIGWGGNQFTPLLSVYRQHDGYSQVAVDVFLGAYVLGLVPGLLLASALSDRFGRRPVMVAGIAASVLGSTFLALGQPVGAGALFAGRLLSGVAVGIAMAVGTAWVSELSAPAFDPSARPGTGPRRASISLTLGLGAGPGVAGVLAQWGPLPLTLPYLVQIALMVPAATLLALWSVETRHDRGAVRIRQRLRVPSAAHRRFRAVVLPMAPWIFGSAAIAYAVVPQLVHARTGHWSLIYATALTVATLGTGVAVQPVARRLDTASTARAVVVSMVLMSLGMVASVLAAQTGSPWLGAPVAILLGAAYGIAVVSGLLEVQRIAAADELAGLTGVYYGLAYIGFLLPAVLAALSRWVGYPVMLACLAALAVACTATIARSSRRHLPIGAGPAAAPVPAAAHA